jgi:hypothetical protein
MQSAAFYSDRTGQPQPRLREEISAGVWRGLATLLLRRVDDGSLALDFPAYGCRDHSAAITGTNPRTLDSALSTLIPELHRTRGILDPANGTVTLLNPYQAPATPVVLDVVDFVGQHLAEPAMRRQHLQHEHFEFDPRSSRTRGQRRFREDVELIFARNGIAFTIGEDMKTARIGRPESRALLSELVPNTGDAQLDEFLRDAHTRFLSRHSQDRVVALEKLWKAFERLKTLEVPTANKRTSAQQLIAKAAPDSQDFQARLEAEFAELTKIGNGFYIRHSEVRQQPLPTPIEASVDYLFPRLLSLIAYLLRQTGRV